MTQVEEKVNDSGDPSHSTDDRRQSEQFENVNDILEAVYIQACYSSLGAALVVESRPDFDAFIKKTSGLMLMEDSLEKPATIRYLPMTYPSIYDYNLDVTRQIWVPWMAMVPDYIHDRNKNFSDILVPTIDTIRTSWFLKLINGLRKPVVLVGETGTSKTAVIQELLRNLNADKFVRFKVI